MSKKPYLITTAIAYASKLPHIGNMYDHVCADAIARAKRMQGYDVFFLTGTDEHGLKIEEEAEKQHITPKQHVDNISAAIRAEIDGLNVSYDKFIRTTDEEHEKCLQKAFDRLYEQGDIYKSEYEGWYCLPCESFFTEVQLKDGRCPDCGAEVRKTKEEAYFFKLSKYQKQIEDFFENNPDFIQPVSRKNEMLNNFVKPGLQDFCITRTSFKWGVPVDIDPKHIIYVWIDALNNYITALGYDPENPSENYKKYWENCVHVIGKDILRFHSIYWVAWLMALGAKLPKQIFAHPWLLFGEDKMSKSKGNVIYAGEMVKRFGADAVRYYMLSEMPFAADGSISYETFIDRYNTDLANTLGNLVNRTVAMVNKYFGGVVGAPSDKNDTDRDLEEKCIGAAKKFTEHVDAYRLADAVEDVIALARRANKYIDETTPWALAKNEADKPRLQTVLYELIEAIRFIGILCSPIIPETSGKILAQINTDITDFETLAAFGGYVAGTKVGEAEPLFARIDPKLLDELVAEMEATKAKAAAEAAKSASEESAPAPIAPEIDIDEFFKADLRAGKVVGCEKVEKSKKLLRIKLDDGFGGRQVLSGIAKWYSPEDLIGRTVLFVANLKPAKLAGELSEGMICAADMPDGSAKVCFLDDSTPAGAKIR